MATVMHHHSGSWLWCLSTDQERLRREKIMLWKTFIEIPGESNLQAHSTRKRAAFPLQQHQNFMWTNSCRLKNLRNFGIVFYGREWKIVIVTEVLVPIVTDITHQVKVVNFKRNHSFNKNQPILSQEYADCIRSD